MSLNNINLTPSLLVDLWANVLVEGDTMNMPEPEKPTHLGENKKGILIVVAHTGVQVLPDTELTFLMTVLGACKLTLADVAIVNFLKDKRSYAEWISIFNTNTILVFGPSPIDLGLPINFPNFQVQYFDNRTYITGPSLTAIENDKDLKMELWTSLKKHFGL